MIIKNLNATRIVILFIYFSFSLIMLSFSHIILYTETHCLGGNYCNEMIKSSTVLMLHYRYVLWLNLSLFSRYKRTHWHAMSIKWIRSRCCHIDLFSLNNFYIFFQIDSWNWISSLLLILNELQIDLPIIKCQTWKEGIKEGILSQKNCI